MVASPNAADFHKAACKLFAAGFSVIPLIPGQKRPAVPWEQYQYRRATIRDINAWWAARNNSTPYGIGVVTGTVSKSAVLDIDPVKGYAPEALIAEAEQSLGISFPTTCCVSTSGGSYHYHYSTDEPVQTTVIYQSDNGKIELRGDGAIVVMPPSVAYSKRTGTVGSYTYVTLLEDRKPLEKTWQHIGKKNTTPATIDESAPTPKQIQATVNANRALMSTSAKNILSGKTVPDDRSKQCYFLACELVRNGITDQRTLATIIMAAPYHQQKYGSRPKNSAWGEWNHALTVAARALEESATPATQKQTPPQQNDDIQPFPFILTSLANVDPEQTNFLVHPYIPLGEATILDGDPGVGKSWAWMALAAGLTGSPICPIPHDHNAKRDAKVVIMTAEDSITKTLRTRLEMLGANLNSIYVFVPDESIKNNAYAADQPTAAYAEQALVDIQLLKPDMVVIDPITLYATTEKEFNSNASTDVRRMLMRLVAAARQMNFALVLCRHYRKTAGKAIYRGTGSIDFVAAARSVLSFGKDAVTGERLFVHSKANLSSCGPAQAFALNESTTPPFSWLGSRDGINPDAITGDALASEEADNKTKMEDALDFCLEMLKDGPMLAQTILEKGKKLGLSERTIRRARDQLRITSYSSGFGNEKKFFWKLPKEDA
jgi:hypothetical protein